MPHSYYWTILEESELYNPDEKPTEFGLGDLFEDWEFLTAQLTKDTPVVGLNLSKLASILRAIEPKILG